MWDAPFSFVVIQAVEVDKIWGELDDSFELGRLTHLNHELLHFVKAEALFAQKLKSGQVIAAGGIVPVQLNLSGKLKLQLPLLSLLYLEVLPECDLFQWGVSGVIISILLNGVKKREWICVQL